MPELPTSITVGIKDINETIEEINEYYSSGFRYIKIKLGDKINYDIERIINKRPIDYAWEYKRFRRSPDPSLYPYKNI